ncbi:MAG: hypothetical protein ACOYNS_13240 [Bacteroidota bacterium]
MNLISALSFHRLKKIIKNAPNLLSGYNLYVDSDKLRLIDHAFTKIVPGARSFADLGGVWNVNAGYTIYTLRNHGVAGTLVDTNFPDGLREQLSQYNNLSVIHGDFSKDETVAAVGKTDVVFFFDVLLHQANPSWTEILKKYAANVSCFVIFNQQYIRGTKTVRLTDMPIDEYISVAPQGREATYRYAYDHANEIHPEYKKPWKDIHNIFQWGITDEDLRATMEGFGFKEMYYKNHGRFSNLPAFENHAFIFVKR